MAESDASATPVPERRHAVAAAAPLLVACVVFLAGLAVVVVLSRRLTGGRLVYPLDDAYIHMAVAGNLAQHGVWGVTRHGFSSATSSLAWPILLAAGNAAGGPRDALPLALNAAAGLLCLIAAARALGDRPPWRRLAVLLALVVLTPLPTLAAAGMEHTLHAWATLLLGALLLRALDSGPGPPRRHPSDLALAGAAAVAGALRYESLFLAAAAALLLALHGRRRSAAVLGAAALAPAAAYAVVSVARGWYPLPNPVLLKGARFDPSTAAGIVEMLGGRGLRMLAQAPHLLALVAAALALLAFGRGRPAERALLAVFAIATLLHLQLADTGWLYRYEAYLVALGVFALGACAPERVALPGRAATAAAVALAVVMGYPLAARAARAFAETPRASKNIFDQQYQMGLFLRRFYPGAAVAANDIGAITYLADVRLLDLYGLASMDVARARRAGGLAREDVERLAAAHGTEVALVYRSWFSHALPPGWMEAGSWRAPEKVVVAERVVTFYAPDPAAHERLVRSLRAFAPELPRDVVVRFADEP